MATKKIMLNTFHNSRINFGSGVIQIYENGSIYLVPRELYVYRIPLVAQFIAQAVSRFPHLLPAIAPTEFEIYMGDFPFPGFPNNVSAPVLGYTQGSLPAKQISVPDYSYVKSETQRPEEQELVNWEDWHREMPKIARKTPYRDRIKKLIFRGSRNKVREGFVNFLLETIPGFQNVTEELDIGVFRRDFQFTAVPTIEYTKYAVMLYMHGNGASARLKILFMTGSPVIVHVAGVLEDFWRPLLQPDVHYKVANTYQEILDVNHWLLTHPTEAEAMAAAAMEVVVKYLTYESVHCHWLAVLTEYKPKLGYAPTKHEHMVTVREGNQTVTPELYLDIHELSKKFVRVDHEQAMTTTESALLDVLTAWKE
jgi:hypothetical protein